MLDKADEIASRMEAGSQKLELQKSAKAVRAACAAWNGTDGPAIVLMYYAKALDSGQTTCNYEDLLQENQPEDENDPTGACFVTDICVHMCAALGQDTAHTAPLVEDEEVSPRIPEAAAAANKAEEISALEGVWEKARCSMWHYHILPLAMCIYSVTCLYMYIKTCIDCFHLKTGT